VTTPALYVLEVSTEKDDYEDDKTVIEISWNGGRCTDDAALAEKFGNPTGMEMLIASGYVAGLLARLAATANGLSGHLFFQGDERKKPRVQVGELLAPWDLGSGPYVSITVLTRDVKEGLERIKGWLSEIVSVPLDTDTEWLAERITRETIERDKAIFDASNAARHAAHREWLTTTLEGRAFLSSSSSYFVNADGYRAWRPGKSCQSCSEAVFTERGSVALALET
jgi:hypothetical protein